MSALNRLRVVVAGAGAVGSVVALQLARAGIQVLLVDPAPRGDNASGVAAGMLAPVFETLLDRLPGGGYPLLQRARDGWPALLEGVAGAPTLYRSGAMMPMADETQAQAWAAEIVRSGGRAYMLDAKRAGALIPGVAPANTFLFTPEEWRLAPGGVLAALQDQFEALGGQRLAASALGFQRGRVRFDRGSDWQADAVVLATGFGNGDWAEAGGEAGLTPIKGQILRLGGVGPRQGPILRGEGVYIVPDPGGAIVGATMEVGRSDLAVDPDQTGSLIAAAARLLPDLEGAAATASVGVRAATRDGLPLVGPSAQSGVLLARGARRNGWLLAPMIGQVILDSLYGRPVSEDAMLFDPARFG
jgi:glycine oxidase